MTPTRSVTLRCAAAKRGGARSGLRGAGLTLVEVLVALAVVGVVTAAFASLVVSARRTASSAALRSDTQQTLDLAGGLLTEELRLAGSAPWPRPALVDGVEDVDAFLEVALWLETDAHDPEVAVRLRFVDVRGAGTPVARDMTFEVGVDARGAWQLYRKPAGASRQPLVENVRSLRLAGIVVDGVLHQEPPAGTYRPSALLLDVGIEAASRRLVVPLPSRPTTFVTTAAPLARSGAAAGRATTP